MRWFALACVLAAGCDRLFALERLPDITHDAGGDAKGEGDDAEIDAPLDDVCPAGYEFQSLTGTAYKIHNAIDGAVDWNSAKVACKGDTPDGGRAFTHLAVFGNKAEYDLIYGMLGAMDAPWVGAYDDFTSDSLALFRWVTTEQTTQMPWGPSQPDQPDYQNCARMWLIDGMDNELCTAGFGYVCECDTYPDVLP